MLSKFFCRAKRKTAFICKSNSLPIGHDYTERLLAHFDLEIRSEHLGNSIYL